MQVETEVLVLLVGWWVNCGPCWERWHWGVHWELLCDLQHIGSPGVWGNEAVEALVNLEQTREVVKKEEVELPEGEEKAVETPTLPLRLPLFLGQPELEAVGKRWREGRQVRQGVPKEKAGQGGWRRPAELGLARLFLAPVCDLPQAGVWALTLLTWTFLVSGPFLGLCWERIPGLESSFCWEISEKMWNRSCSSSYFSLSWALPHPGWEQQRLAQIAT